MSSPSPRPPGEPGRDDVAVVQRRLDALDTALVQLLAKRLAKDLFETSGEGDAR